MGLAGDLSYRYERPNPFHRAMQTVASTRGGAWIFSKTLPWMDGRLAKWSNGRLTVPAVMARLPVLVLTSTGRKSGHQRHTHLVAVPFGDTLALLGTNFGQASTPAWVFNLETDPRAFVTYHEVTREVVARRATDDERAQILSTAATFYRGYAKYRERITNRELRIFVLEPVG
jgi:deazaflavin-dependent oxidoreductase (nitroreductase family)